MQLFTFLFGPAELTMGLNIALGVIALVILIYGVLSMLKRALPQAFSIVSFILLMAVGIILVNPLSKTLASTDISSLVKSFDMNGQTVNVTTVKDTIMNMLTVMAGEANEKDFLYLALTNPDLAAYLEALTLIIISYLTFFLYVFLVFIVGKPFCALVYHCGFKFIFSKKTRKYRYKKKWKSVLIGVVNASLSFAMLISPLFSIVNTVNYGLHRNQTAAGDIIDEASYNEIMKWADAYNDSLFAKILFGIKDGDGRSLDIMLMDFVTKTDYKDSQLLFSDQIMTIADTAEKLIATGILQSTTEGFNMATLLSKSFINSVITTITKSDFFMNIIPILMNVALTYANNNELLDATKVNIESVDWANEFEKINAIYASVYDTGLIDELTSEEGIQGIPLEDDDLSYFHAAFNTLNESEFLNQLVSAVAYSLITKKDESGDKSDLANYLSEDWQDYESIKWGDELTVIYDTLYQLNKVDISITIVSSGKSKPKLAPNTSFKNSFIRNIPVVKEAESGEENQSDDLLNKIIEKYEQVVPILTGYDKDGKEIENSQFKTIFDSNLVYKSIAKILNYVADTVLTPDATTGEAPIMKAEDLKNAINEIENTEEESKRGTYKKEVYNLLKCAYTFLGDSSFDMSDPEQLLNNEGFKNALKELSVTIDDSIILRNVVPGILEVNLSSLSFGDSVPLDGSDLNFRGFNYAEEIPLLLETYDKITELSESLNGDNMNAIIDNIDTDNLAIVLKDIRRSKIINPVKDGVENVNFLKIMDLIFANESFKDVGIYKDKDVDYSQVSNWESEIDGIANIFGALKADSILSLFDSSASVSLTSIETEEIKALFASIDGSILIKNTFGSLLDNLLKDVIDMSDNEDMTFNNVTNWSEEGIALAEVIGGLQKLNADISNINWLDSNPEICEEILTSFISMKVFKDDASISKFLWNTISTSGGDMMDYLKDYPAASEATKTYTMAKADFENVAKWSDEISLMMDFIATLQNNNGEGKLLWSGENNTQPSVESPGTKGLNLLTSGNASKDQLTEVLNSLNNVSVFRMITVNAINDVITSLSSSVDIVDLSSANIKCIVDDKEVRTDEINLLPSLYDSVQDVNDMLNTNTYDADKISELLTSLHDSKIFNSFESDDKMGVVGTDRNLTVFESAINELLMKVDAGKYIADNDDKEVQRAKIKSNILSINNKFSSDTDGWTESNGEITRIHNIVDSFNAIGASFDVSAVIENDTTAIKNMMKAINRSHLTHDAIPVFLREMLSKISIQSLTDNADDIDYNLSKQSYASEEAKMDAYDDEIDYFVGTIDMVKLDDGWFDFTSDSFIDLLTPETDGGIGKSSVPFFTLMKESKILEQVRSEMIVNIIDKTGNLKYIRDISGSYSGTKEDKILKVESYFTDNGYDLNAVAEGKSIDKIVPVMNLSEITDGEEFLEILASGDKVEEIIKNTKPNISDTERHRAYFSSEIVTGFLTAYGPDGTNKINWVRTDATTNIDSFELLNDNSAAQLKDMFMARTAIDNVMNNINEETKAAFKTSMAKLDSHREEPEFSEVLDKLAHAMFYDTICSKVYSVFYWDYEDGNGFVYVGTINQHFKNKHVEDSFEQQADCFIEAINILPSI